MPIIKTNRKTYKYRYTKQGMKRAYNKLDLLKKKGIKAKLYNK